MSALIAFISDWMFCLIAIGFLIPAFVCNDVKYYGWSAIWMIASIASIVYFFFPTVSSYVESVGVVETIIYGVGFYVIGGVITALIYWVFFNWRAKEQFEMYLNRIDLPRWALDSRFLFGNYAFADAFKQHLVLREYRFKIFDDPHGRMLYLDCPSEDYNLHLLAEHYTKINDCEEELANGATGRDAVNFTDTRDRSLEHFQQILNALYNRINKNNNELLPPKFSTCKRFIVGAAYTWPITLVWLAFSRMLKQMIERIISLFGSVFDKISAYAFGTF